MRHIAILLGLLLPTGAAAQDPSAAKLEYFEKKIRPILVQRCYSCHSRDAEKLKGNLYLDSRAGWEKGGDSGVAIVPGKPGESLLIKAVRYDVEPGMPPKGKLPEAEIAALAEWVREGAIDPRKEGLPAAAKKKVGPSVEEGRSFWAYRPLAKPAVPSVRDETWASDDLDRFILARVEKAGGKPAAQAGRALFARRIYFDLTGMPPTPEEIDAFVADKSPDAVGKLVDRLLASPRFGERWGRHWLDVARFAESFTLRGFVMGEAWRYRDYVIDAFNADLPYDQFVREQVAGDLLESKSLDERRRRLVATAFLLMGNSNLENQDKRQLEVDVVDEQLDTLGRALLAQTIGCARCHDHKFDPIPTRDYYAMAGILINSRTLDHSNVSKWIEAPLPVEPARAAVLKKHETAVKALEKDLKVAKDGVTALKRKQNPTGVIPVSSVQGIVVDDEQAVKVGVWQHSTWSGNYIGKGYCHDQKIGKGERSLTYEPELKAGSYEVRFAYSHGGSRASNVPVTILTAEGEKTVIVDMRKPPPVDGRYVSLGLHRFENNQGYVIVSNEGTQGYVTADAVVFIPEKELGPETAVTASEKKASSQRAAVRVKKLEAELKKLKAAGPKRDLAMAFREEKKVQDLPVHVRGNVHTLGEVVPRGFLQVATAGKMPSLPADQSGRREFADWIASDRNPLTARVIVNRAWHWMFGAGIVRSTDNFGFAGERPSHPELLDFLAARFIEEGWSIKTLVRRLATSSTYRMVSAGATAPGDPENRLLGKMNRRRLEAECIRDAMLEVSGKLDGTRGGRSFKGTVKSDYGYKSDNLRRSVYLPVFRNSLPEIFKVFDFANSSVATGRRDASTVAPQALYLMNSPFVQARARDAAARLRTERHESDDARVVRAYRWALGRAPTDAERAIARGFVADAKDTSKAWSQLFQALFCSIEFRYVK